MNRVARRFYLVCGLASKLGWVVAWMAASAIAGEPASPRAEQTEQTERPFGVLRLAEGNIMSGQLQASGQPDDASARPVQSLVVLGESFTQPFEFSPTAIRSFTFPLVKEFSSPSGQFTFELSTGDSVSGDLVSWGAGEIVIDSTHFGRRAILAKDLLRVDRITENPLLVFSGLAGLQDWRDTVWQSSRWKEDGNQLWTDEDNAMLSGDFDLPQRAVIDFQLSWSENAEFVFSLGVDTQLRDELSTDGWRFESWGNTLAAVREHEELADVCLVADLTKQSTVHLVAYLDQSTDEMHLYHPDGQVVGALRPLQFRKPKLNDPESADFEQPDPKDVVWEPGEGLGQGIRFHNRHGQVRLQRLRVSRWTGSLPGEQPAGQIQVVLTKGETVSGDTLSFGGGAEQLALISGTDRTSVPLETVAAIKFNHRPPTQSAGGANDPQVDPSSDKPRFTIVLHDGTRIRGAILAVTRDVMLLSSASFDEPLSIAHQQIRSLILSNPRQLASDDNKTLASAEQSLHEKKGRLVVGETKLEGQLVSAEVSQSNSSSQQSEAPLPLNWHPTGSRTSSPLKTGTSGRIIYHEPESAPAIETTSARQRQQEGGFMGGADPFGNRVFRARNAGPPVQRGLNFGELFFNRLDGTERSQPRRDDLHAIHLRSGDVLPCTVLGSDESGVTLKTTVSDAGFIPHQRIKAVVLQRDATMPDLNEAKRKRLLTLPRLQQGSPPTHLLCAPTGDLLRCRLLGLSDEVVRVEVQLEEIEILRQRVNQIIWLHPEDVETVATDADEQTTANSDEKPVDTQGAGGLFANRVQVFKRNGDRVTFDPIHVQGGEIVGVSNVLGKCRFQLQSLNQIVFGAEIRRDASQLVYHQWRLSPARLPLIALASDSAADDGMVSALVGQPAPELRLRTLDDEAFQLSDCQGQIVVLDFWASWCAPCMQTMPLVEEAIADFDPSDVRLVSVNLQEPAAHVRSVLDRHGLNMEVVLDIDGVAAQRFQANAIPQLVVVDRDGSVARLYVGGGPGVVDQLKSALQQMTSGDEPTGGK